MATKQPPPSSSTSGAGVSMKDYLRRYQSGRAAAGDQKKAKKKKKSPKPSAGGVLIVDEDPVWQKPVQIEDELSSGDEKPQVNEDIEVKRMRRMETIRAARPYNSIANDGSGWVTLPVPEPAGSCSPRHRRRNDTRSPEEGGPLPSAAKAAAPSPEQLGDKRINEEVIQKAKGDEKPKG
ncbi:uncharacterized protein LOC123427258 isoform X1 [Hordeum vulgare subsp. vulgare]|uniref:uncharacterized protein LOC123427258 isoform X1 n=2 Tax=Hordeum vulgare subsp. vulgare TaxID=112509 RepID=UPI001D1A3F6D|nr:uncharacterized protein LOC123427258 isoform X1 [Hordeum vulgare subsp. vulgare]